MAIPSFTMRQLLDAGVHFGHQTHRWNPKMAPYIFGARNNVHILDLSQTVPHLYRALKQIRDVAASGGRILFVGTKRQASAPIAEAAKRCGQYYVNHRWLGGMLTNWNTISGSIKRLKELDVLLTDGAEGLTKKETLQMTRQRDKLERALGGIREMGGLPSIIFVIDTNREEIAINEARNLNIPVVGILDTNSDPADIAFPVPGNDDATRAILLYLELISGAVLDGIQAELNTSGVDIGSQAEPTSPVEATSVEATSVETIPVKAAPVKVTPVKATPVKAAPVKATPVKATPVKAAPVKAAPVKAAPVKADGKKVSKAKSNI